jgi:hypothetical protein
VDFNGNVVHNNGHHGLYPAHPGRKVINNIVFDNADNGIHCRHNRNQQVISNNCGVDIGAFEQLAPNRALRVSARVS